MTKTRRLLRTDYPQLHRAPPGWRKINLRRPSVVVVGGGRGDVGGEVSPRERRSGKDQKRTSDLGVKKAKLWTEGHRIKVGN